MHHLRIFTDTSVNSRSKVGYGAYLVVTDLDTPIAVLKSQLKIKRFEQTSSTKSELQTLLWALYEVIDWVEKNDTAFTLYTDSQNIVDLPNRRRHLEQRNYYSSKNRRLNNYEMYQEFYRLTSSVTCKLVKVIGHQASNNKDDIDRLFSLVDKASRRALREEF